MNVKIEDAGACRKLMHISTTSDEVREDYEELLGWFRKGGRVAGFRKGKAPTSVVEAQYKKDLAESAKERLVPRTTERLRVPRAPVPGRSRQLRDASR